MMRHATPKLIEAKIVPTVLFLSLLTISLTAALVGALIWVTSCFGFRRATGRYIPGLVVIGLISLTVRTIITLMTGSTLVYFLQPMMTTTCMGLAFLWSVRMGKPLAARIAYDFCPYDEETAKDPIVERFFKRMSVLWGIVSILNGAVTLWMLFTVDIATFVLVKSIMGPGLTFMAVMPSIIWLRRRLKETGTTLVFTKTVGPVVATDPLSIPVPALLPQPALANAA